LPIPTTFELIQPLLGLVSKGEISIQDATDRLADELSLSPAERMETLSTGKRRFYDRVSWARVHLRQAGLIELPARGLMRITPEGENELKNNSEIDRKALLKFKSYQEFIARSEGDRSKISETKPAEPNVTEKILSFETLTPEEKIENAYDEITTALKSEILDRIIKMAPEFFEQVIIDLMITMGYGGSKKEAAEHLGRSGVGGVDGIIRQDQLGLDVIYLQAKRYARDRVVGVEKVREFAGALAEQHATKGVLVTTSRFAPAGLKLAQKLHQRMILIDGDELATLLIKHNVGVREFRTVNFKRLDEDYFSS
jgi:restriction system protein